MQHREFTDATNIHYVRVPKNVARRAFENNEILLVCPVNIRMGYPWFPEVKMMNITGEDFETVCARIEYHNCNNETGRYLAFYRRDM